MVPNLLKTHSQPAEFAITEKNMDSKLDKPVSPMIDSFANPSPDLLKVIL